MILTESEKAQLQILEEQLLQPEVRRSPEAINSLLADEFREKESFSLRNSIWKFIDGRWQLVFHQGTPTNSI